jgi:hypothetical protein
MVVFLFFSLYVEAPFYGTSQDCNWGWVAFCFALFFNVCYGVVMEFFSTCLHRAMLRSTSCVCETMHTLRKNPHCQKAEIKANCQKTPYQKLFNLLSVKLKICPFVIR